MSLRVRLACIPDDGRAEPALEYAPVLDHVVVAAEHYLTTLDAPRIARRAEPGQFAMLTVARAGEDSPVLPRPMALYDWDAVAGRVRVMYRIFGDGTARLAGWPIGEPMAAVGPLGRPFTLAETTRGLLLLGRGIGICSLTALAARARARGVAVHAVVSARRPDAIIAVDDLAAIGATVWPVVDTDGSSDVDRLGARLHRWLEDRAVDQVAVCGSERLLRLASEIGQRHDARVEVSLEARMACGLGYCHGCSTGEKGLAREAPLVCKDGPVFLARAELAPARAGRGTWDRPGAWIPTTPGSARPLRGVE